MNREIKFRGIELESKNWVYGSLINCDPIPEIEENEYDEGAYGHQRWEVIPESVGQFTGLSDKNGVEIYEGDILTSDFYPFNDNGMSNYVGVVIWIFSSWQMVLKCVNPLKSGISSGINHDLSEYIGDNDVLNFEIIGNIHENPELLNPNS